MRRIGKKKTLQGKEILANATDVLSKDSSLPPEVKLVMSALVEFSSVLLNHLGLNSTNSSVPPSQDPNRTRKTSTAKGRRRKPGAQPGHEGSCLLPSENPNETEQIFVDRKTLPPGKYQQVGFEKRQVFDVSVSVHVKEYQAEILTNKLGEQFVADFPVGVTQSTQYGSSVKAMSVFYHKPR